MDAAVEASLSTAIEREVTVNPLQQLLKFLGHLDSLGAGYILSSDAESIIVIVRTEGGMHEISFFADGTIAAQSFEQGEEAEAFSLEDLTSAPEFRPSTCFPL